jgi:hypothetical protein
MVRLQVAHGFDPSVIERSMRVYGESLRRMAEADWCHTQIDSPCSMPARAPDKVMEVSKRFGAAWNELGDLALIAIYHGQQERAWMRNIIEGVESALELAGYARSGEVLVSDAPVLPFAAVRGCRFEPIGSADLKGMAQSVALHLAKRGK